MTSTQRSPHLRVTTSDLKWRYEKGFLTVRGYIYDWLLAAKRKGWRLRTTVKDFCEELGIGRTAFYKAIADLRGDAELQFRFEILGEVEMWVGGESSSSTEKVSAIANSESTIANSKSAIANSESAIADEETPNLQLAARSQDSPTLIRSFTDLDHLSLSCPPTASPEQERKESDFVVEEKENSAVDRPQLERESDRLEPNFNQTELKQIHSSGEDSKSSAPAPSAKNSFEIAKQDRDFMKWAEARSSGMQARNPKIHAQTCLKRDENLELWQQYQARKRKPQADAREFANQSEYAAYVAKRREELLCQ